MAAILVRARAAGVGTLDTAIGYGNSEQRLGEAGVAAWDVITKLPPLPDACADVEQWVIDAANGSLARLGIDRLYGLLLHRSQQLLGPHGEALYRAMAGLKERGLVNLIGVSVYGPDELAALAAFQLDLVQAPFNLFDRRLAHSGWLARLHDQGTEVHVRSVFLQGLLLMDAGQRPAFFARWQPLWDRWHQWLADSGQTALEACLAFPQAFPEIKRLVVGVDGLSHLQEILGALDAPRPVPPDAVQSDDLDLINPSRWSAR